MEAVVKRGKRIAEAGMGWRRMGTSDVTGMSLRAYGKRATKKLG